jgi:hypothetical protein
MQFRIEHDQMCDSTGGILLGFLTRGGEQNSKPPLRELNPQHAADPSDQVWRL